MLPAVSFDNQAMLGAGEIDNVIANWVLAPKSVTSQAAVAQERP
jgi:hypothetical protein